MISGIILWIIFIALSALSDYWIIEKKKILIDEGGHIFRSIMRIIAGIICASMGSFGFGYGLVFMLFEAASFWLLFDGLLNLLRKKGLLYVGFNSTIDIFFRYHFPVNAEKIMLYMKLFTVLLSIIFLILI